MKPSPHVLLFAARQAANGLVSADVTPSALDAILGDEEAAKAMAEHVSFSQRLSSSPRKGPEGGLLVLAVGYAAGRMSAATGLVAGEVEANWDELDGQTKHEIVAAIRRAEEKGGLGMETDARLWQSIVERYDNETAAPRP